jgi:hypothetical protein
MPSWKFSEILTLNSQKAMVIALQEKQTVAMLLEKGEPLAG